MLYGVIDIYVGIVEDDLQVMGSNSLILWEHSVPKCMIILPIKIYN